MPAEAPLLQLKWRTAVPAARSGAAAAWQVWTMAIFTTFSSLVLASKKAWSASLIMLVTQLPLLYTFHR